MIPAIKKIIKKIAPNYFIRFYQKIILNREIKLYKKLDTENKFSHIYKNNVWGNNIENKFYSGSGTHNPLIINPYIKVIKELLNQEQSSTVVDLGCGDFNIGSNFVKLTKKYYAIDVFEDLIKLNKEKFHYSNLEFIKRDITKDDLPHGDFCIIRQVLQHLSNEDIILFLRNINNKYKFLIITEHVPSGKFKSNINIETSHSTRLILNSGVALHHPPFNLNFKKMKEILNISNVLNEGNISTILYTL